MATKLNRAAPALMAGLLCAAMAVPVSAAQEVPGVPLTVQQKAEELDYMVEALEKGHPNLYANISKEEFKESKDGLSARLSTLDDLGYNIELSRLVAKVGDSHTGVGMTLLDDVKALPFAVAEYDGKWILTRLETENAAHLGSELTAIAGVPIAQVEERIADFTGADNEVRNHYRFPNNVYVASLLQYFGIIPAEGPVGLTARAENGKESTFTVERYSLTDRNVAEFKWARLSERRSAVPATEPDRTKNYWFRALNPKTLYIQYNACMEDKNLPMEDFTRQVDEKLDTGFYGKVIVDLRNNGGGSDGLIMPILFRLQEYLKEQNARLYTLIGPTTFSSATINAVEFDVLTDAVLVGTPSGGSVNHFGSVNVFELPHSGIQVQHSTKYIDLDAMMPQADWVRPKPTKIYGARPLAPDVTMAQTLEDYLAGRDTAVEWILKQKI